ncbi:MAG: ATP-binding cassette domain-containing protein [Proteobacteria bacterium]|nr:ATP-binding cassette domain-containing protein [Pseudomonadota bacterium]
MTLEIKNLSTKCRSISPFDPSDHESKLKANTFWQKRINWPFFGLLNLFDKEKNPQSTEKLNKFNLEEISLSVAEGQILTLVGKSGSGKTTLLRCLAGLEEFTADETTIPKEKGMVFQSGNLFSHLNVTQNIELALLKVQLKSRSEAHQISQSVLKKVHLLHRKDAMPSSLSGGEQQRAAIARALALSPKVIFYDEPTSALDPELCLEIYDLMKELKQTGIIQIVVSHDINVVKKISDKIGVMNDGKLIWFGASSSVKEELLQLNAEEQKYLQYFI